MGKFVDLKGKVFVRLTVLEKIEFSKPIKWNCICECGNFKIVYSLNLTNKRTLSCGCLQKEKAKDVNSKHNNCFTLNNKRITSVEYRTWSNLKNRCCNSNYILFHRYGGRGIKVCDRWLNSFENFLEDMGKRPEGTTIDRINNDGNYEPLNCKWATPKEQANNRSNNRLVTFNGKTLNIKQWALKIGIRANWLTIWLNKGMTMKEIIEKITLENI